MLKTLSENHKTKWKNHVDKLVHACNCTKHLSTDCSPYHLMFGCVPRLPIDLIFHRSRSRALERGNERSLSTCFSTFEWRKTKDVIRRNTKRPCLTTLEPGDWLLICKLSERGGIGKMKSYWEDKIYNTVSSIGNDPVIYKITPEHNTKDKTEIFIIICWFIATTCSRSIFKVPINFKRVRKESYQFRS